MDLWALFASSLKLGGISIFVICLYFLVDIVCPTSSDQIIRMVQRIKSGHMCHFNSCMGQSCICHFTCPLLQSISSAVGNLGAHAVLLIESLNEAVHVNSRAKGPLLGRA